MIALASALLLGAAPASASDFSWLIDGEIPARIAAAQAEAERFDASAAESDRLRQDVLARQQAALDEKAKLEATLSTLSRGKRADAEARIRELDGVAAKQASRANELEREAATQRRFATAQRDFTAAAEREAKTRAADEAAHGLPPNADYTPLSDTRLAEVRAWRQRRIARVPRQLAHLDEELEIESSTAARGDVVRRKEEIRASSAREEAEVVRIGDELRFRADSKTDEAILAEQLEAAARAKESERATPTAAPTNTVDHVEAFLDRALAQEDREKAEAASSSKTQRTAGRIVGTAVGFGVLGLTLVFILRRK